MHKFLLPAVVCLLVGCNVQPLPSTGPRPGAPVVEPVVVEKTEKIGKTGNARSMEAALREYPVEVRQAVADVLPALATYIAQGHTGDATRAFRLITRTFADHPVISAQPMPAVAGVVNQALARWSKPTAMPEDWKTGMSSALQELADGAAASVK